MFHVQCCVTSAYKSYTYQFCSPSFEFKDNILKFFKIINHKIRLAFCSSVGVEIVITWSLMWVVQIHPSHALLNSMSLQGWNGELFRLKWPPGNIHFTQPCIKDWCSTRTAWRIAGIRKAMYLVQDCQGDKWRCCHSYWQDVEW